MDGVSQTGLCILNMIIIVDNLISHRSGLLCFLISSFKSDRTGRGSTLKDITLPSIKKEHVHSVFLFGFSVT